ncbi:MAG TPA: DnaJ domain-containing protein [Syntrophobacteria bacterium]|nr:DnaJ domain-containing protein [Syntrophobacteria bacterium]
MRNGWSKVVGAGLGYLAAGPIGAVIGYLVGDKVGPREEGRLVVAVLIGLTATVLKVHGLPPAEDRRRAASFLSRLLSCDADDEGLVRQLLDRFLGLELNIEAMARSFSRSTDHPRRRELVEVLATVCRLQGPVTEELVDLLARIAAALDLSEEDWRAIRASVRASSPALSLDSCYALLEIPVDATMAEVKRAYRNLAKRYHPDHSVAGDSRTGRANTERMALIITAYETIRRDQSR